MLKLNKKVFFAVMTAAVLAPLAAEAHIVVLREGFCDMKNQSPMIQNAQCDAGSRIDANPPALQAPGQAKQLQAQALAYSQAQSKLQSLLTTPGKPSYIGDCSATAIVSAAANLEDKIKNSDDYDQAVANYHATCGATPVPQPALVASIVVDYNELSKNGLTYKQKHVDQAIVFAAKLIDNTGRDVKVLPLSSEFNGKNDVVPPTYIPIEEKRTDSDSCGIDDFVSTPP
jgi:hypothetical protein